jgi:hypothetical protein
MHFRTAVATLWVAAAPAFAAEPGQASPPATVEVAGSVLSVDLQRHRLSVQAATEVVELGWDRNTLIYQPGGATTSSALRPGAVVKAGLDPRGTAYWIQLRPPAPPAPAASPASPAPAASPAAPASSPATGPPPAASSGAPPEAPASAAGR